jgi:protein-S-isoprenylcysteine O-methyltransferase Ste14
VKRRRWGVWGVGPRIVISGVVLYAVIAVLVWRYPWLAFSAERPFFVGGIGWLLIVAAIVVWLVAIRRMRAAYQGGYLETGGVFAWVRNPIYSAFIFIECPGLVLWLWAWPALALPFVAYGLYRHYIPREEEGLRRTFGAAYDAYRRRVPALVPRRPHPQGRPPSGDGSGEPPDRRAAARRAAAARSVARRGGKDRSDSHLRGL